MELYNILTTYSYLLHLFIIAEMLLNFQRI
jgi:hypothetical protein